MESDEGTRGWSLMSVVFRSRTSPNAGNGTWENVDGCVSEMCKGGDGIAIGVTDKRLRCSFRLDRSRRIWLSGECAVSCFAV